MGNTQPIFSRIGDIQWTTTPVTAGTTVVDGTTASTVVWTADATNGGRIERVRFQPLGTNVASVGRVYLNNGSNSAVATNNTLLQEITLAATTVSQVAQLAVYDVILQMAIPPGYSILVTIGTSVAAGFKVIGIGGKY